MNVKQLREKLADLPDDMAVYMVTEPDYNPMPTIENISIELDMSQPGDVKYCLLSGDRRPAPKLVRLTARNHDHSITVGPVTGMDFAEASIALLSAVNHFGYDLGNCSEIYALLSEAAQIELGTESQVVKHEDHNNPENSVYLHFETI